MTVLRWLPAGTASLNMFAIPVIALVASMLIFGERLAANEWQGIGLIGIGLALITAYALVGARAPRLAGRAHRPGAAGLTARLRKRLIAWMFGGHRGRRLASGLAALPSVGSLIERKSFLFTSAASSANLTGP